MQIAAERTPEHAPPNELTDDLLCTDRGVQWFVPAARDSLQQPSRWQRTGWACARLAFHAYVAFSLLTVVGGFLSAPLMTQLFSSGRWRSGATGRPSARRISCDPDSLLPWGHPDHRG